MTTVDGLRAAVTGLIGLAAAAEQVLLAEMAEPARVLPGTPRRWAALPVIAHDTEFRRQQVQRLRAIRCGQAPPQFPAADHESAALYAELAAEPADAVGRDSWRVAGELADEMRLVSCEDLTEPERNPWLGGRSEAVRLNPDVRANALRDSELSALRANRRLSVLGDSPGSGGAS